MLITKNFHQRVEELAYWHALDWRFRRDLSPQDYFLIAQWHLRNKGGENLGLKPDREFVEFVREGALSSYHSNGGSSGDCKQNSNWEEAWLLALLDGDHLKQPLYWSKRSRQCSAAVYFVQNPRERADLSDTAFYLGRSQLKLHGSNPEKLPFLLFRVLSGEKAFELPNLIEGTQNEPTVFIVDAAHFNTWRLRGVLQALSGKQVLWRCDSQFITEKLATFQDRSDPPANWWWANHADNYPDVLYWKLLADILAV